MRGRTSLVNSSYDPILGSGLEIPTAVRTWLGSSGTGGQAACLTMGFVDLGGTRHRRTFVFELVGLRRVPEDGVVERRNLHVLDHSPVERVRRQGSVGDVRARRGI